MIWGVTKRKWMYLAFASVVGTALGVFSHASSSLPGAWRWVGNFGALWLLVAFLVGRRVVTEGLAPAVAGAMTLTIASVVHYVPFRMARDGVSWHAFRWPVVLWVLVGAVVGALFGALGAAHAQRLAKVSIVAVALLVAAFAGEAFILLRTGHPRAVQIAVPVELVFAAVLPLALAASWHERLKVYLYAVLLLPVVVVALAAFMGVIHRVYPGV